VAAWPGYLLRFFIDKRTFEADTPALLLLPQEISLRNRRGGPSRGDPTGAEASSRCRRPVANRLLAVPGRRDSTELILLDFLLALQTIYCPRCLG